MSLAINQSPQMRHDKIKSKSEYYLILHELIKVILKRESWTSGSACLRCPATSFQKSDCGSRQQPAKVVSVQPRKPGNRARVSVTQESGQGIRGGGELGSTHTKTWSREYSAKRVGRLLLSHDCVELCCHTSECSE